jgi:hypothetical protein
MRISDEQGYWLAGYLDGEATFNCSIYIPKSKERKRAARNVNIEMRVAARADEYLLLSECRELTGLGNLYYRPKQTGEGYPVNGKPCWVWTVASKADCQALVELLERYPLRSKKRRDFEIWAQIVDESAKRKPAVRGASINDPTRIEELARELKAVRQYDALYEVVDTINTTNVQSA